MKRLMDDLSNDHHCVFILKKVRSIKNEFYYEGIKEILEKPLKNS